MIETEIIELTHLSRIEIINKIQHILDSSHLQKFTLVLKRKPKLNSQLITKPQKSTADGMQFTVNSIRGNRKRMNKQMSIQYSPYLMQDLTQLKKARSRFSSCNAQQLQQIKFVEEQTPYNRALRNYNTGYYNQALSMFLQLQTQRSKDVNVSPRDNFLTPLTIHIGNCYYRLKENLKAIQYYNKSGNQLSLKEQGQKMHNIGSCHAMLGQYKIALKCYGQALKIYSDCPGVDCSNLLNNLGMVYLKSGMFQTAQKYFGQAIDERKQKSPQHANLLFYSYKQMGICQKQRKKYAEAIQSLQFALNFAERGFGNLAQTLKQLAQLHEMLEKWGQALLYYEKLSDYHELNGIQQGFIYESVAKIHQNMGNFVEYSKFIKMAYTEYAKAGNQRKMSDLANACRRISKKKNWKEDINHAE